MSSPHDANKSPSLSGEEASPPPRKKAKVTKHGLTRKTTNKKTVISAQRPRNKAELDALNKSPQPSMWKYVALPKGRHKKPKEPTSAATTLPSPPVNTDSSHIVVKHTRKPKRKKTKINWKEGINKEAMDIALQSMLMQGNAVKAIAAAQEKYPVVIIPRQTLDSKFAKLKEAMSTVDECNELDDLDMFDRHKSAAMKKKSNNTNSLTTAEDRQFLQSLVLARDNRNCGVSRKEIVSIIAEIKSVGYTTAENHYDYLIRSKQLCQLKNNGRVVSAQPTTTNRTAVTTEKLLRTYSTQEQAWAMQDELNGWDRAQMTPAQLKEHKHVRDAHTCNLDESCMMASEGIVRIIGSKAKKKHEKNISDSRDSITVVRIGSAANVDGPRIYLAKGKEIELPAFRNFTKNFVAPPGSCIEMTPSAYMTDEAWRNIGPKMCEGIRSMNGVRKDCWVVFSLDGFGSHLDAEQLLVFSEYKILVIKEEGDTSQISQAYDQIVAKEDKRRARELLDVVKRIQRSPVNQWDLIVRSNKRHCDTSEFFLEPLLKVSGAF